MIPMIAQSEASEQQIASVTQRFAKKFRVGSLLRRCNAGKQKGIPVVRVFLAVLAVVFSGCSMYLNQRLGKWTERMSKNTVYRFLNDSRINWERMMLETAVRAAEFLAPLTSEERTNVLIVDDTIYTRDRSKQSELLSRVYDHNEKKYHNGYRTLVVGWSDGNTFIPVSACLLASSNEDLIVGPVSKHDGRTLAARRRLRAQTKGTDVMLDMVHAARKAGLPAQHVLFDSWFFSRSTATALWDRDGLYVIAMAKKSNMKYRVVTEDGARMMTARQIYRENRKRPGRSRWLLSVEAELSEDENTPGLPVRLVFVRNRNRRKDWLVLACTDMSLPEDEIIRLYGKRWQIETFFKVCKQYLRLTNECHSLSYDALTAHLCIVLCRYVMLAIEQRSCADQRTLGELFRFAVDELRDITLAQALIYIMRQLASCDAASKVDSTDAASAHLDEFIDQLPAGVRRALTCMTQRCA